MTKFKASCIGSPTVNMILEKNISETNWFQVKNTQIGQSGFKNKEMGTTHSAAVSSEKNFHCLTKHKKIITFSVLKSGTHLVEHVITVAKVWVWPRPFAACHPLSKK